MTEQPHHFIKRRKILVDRKFQLQYFYIWLFTAIGMMIVAAGFYYVTSKITNMAVSTWVVRLMMGTGVFILFFTFLMGTISVVLTHRVAGAVFRINGFIRKVMADDYSDFIKLRKTDYLHNIADSLNELNHKLAERWKRMVEIDDKAQRLQALIAQHPAATDEMRSLAISVATLAKGSKM